MTSRQASTSVPFGQGGPFVSYPHSPALIGSNGIFLFTPQPPLTPRLGSNGTMIPLEGPGSFNYMQGGGGVPNEGYQRQGYMPQTAFPFPDITSHGDPSASLPNEIKTESQMSSPVNHSLHKSQPVLANGGGLMPFNMTYENASYLHTGGGTSMPLTHAQHVNSNNNNSINTTDTNSSCANNHMTNSLSYMSRIFPGPLPSSPGFFMAHSCKILHCVI